MKKVFLFILVTIILLLSINPKEVFAEETDGELVYGVTTKTLAFRNENGEFLENLPANELISIIKEDPNDEKRYWILWNGKEGSVIKSGVVNSEITKNNLVTKAITKTKLNMRIPETYEYIESIPKLSEITIIGEDKYHKGRIVVKYDGKQGSVLKSGIISYKDEDLIVVNKEAQTVQMIKDGKLIIYSNVVTGKKGRDTPKGIYSIYKLEKNATLRGQDYTSKVKYWMPFYKGYGLHDANWRSSFGGKIYIKNGSHGCVNLPENVAKKMFENAHKGYKVIVK